MALGKPTIAPPRDLSLRALQNLAVQIETRFLAIEAVLNDLPDVALQGVLQSLSNQQSGMVAYVNKQLITRQIKNGTGTTVTNGDGVLGNPTITSP